MKRRGISLSDLSPSAQAQAARQIVGDIEGKPNKYHAQKCRYKSTQGFERVFDSKKEAAEAVKLDLALRAGIIKWWLPQVPIPLPGGVRYIADFLIGDLSGGVRWRDAKGRDTQASINKRRQVLAIYGIAVEIV